MRHSSLTLITAGMGTKSIGSLMKPNAVVASEIKLKQNCFVSVLFQM